MIELKFSKKIYSSFILLLICSTIIATAGIKGFKRLAPAIKNINNRNTQSLLYAEQMLKSVSSQKDIKTFEQNLEKSKQNITEDNEQEAIIEIEKDYKRAFNGDRIAEEKTIDDIIYLTSINRKAMIEAGNQALKLENIGIWLIIFPTIFAWIIGIMLLKLLYNSFIKPLSILKSVISDYRKGNKMRRCPKISQSAEFQEIYNDINTILDNK